MCTLTKEEQEVVCSNSHVATLAETVRARPRAIRTMIGDVLGIQLYVAPKKKYQQTFMLFLWWTRVDHPRTAFLEIAQLSQSIIHANTRMREITTQIGRPSSLRRTQL